MEPIGVYIHIPFCRHKCVYCDFNSYAGQESVFAPYLDAVQREISMRSELLADAERRAVRTLYIGGGTPTVLPVDDLIALIRLAQTAFTLPSGSEITVEANPGTISVEGLTALRTAGVSRLSLGVQSFDDAALASLGRIHSGQEARQAICGARAAGFDNLSLDLMFGLPGQTLSSWQADVEVALSLTPEHLSLYALTVEPGTPLAEDIAHGGVAAPDDDLAADMYVWTEARLVTAGYDHYEISNWARPGFECQHNLIYWRNQPYLGLGAGAHGWWRGKRRANIAQPDRYVAAIQAGQMPIDWEEKIERRLEMGETMMMGLRLLQEGVEYARFANRFGDSLEAVYGSEIDDLVVQGLLEQRPQSIRLTPYGHLLGNLAFACFLPE